MVNYSRIIGESMVLMKKPSVSESPLRQGTRTCPRWYLAETEACGGGKLLSMIAAGYAYRDFLGKYAKNSPAALGARLAGLWDPYGTFALLLPPINPRKI